MARSTTISSVLCALCVVTCLLAATDSALACPDEQAPLQTNLPVTTGQSVEGNPSIDDPSAQEAASPDDGTHAAARALPPRTAQPLPDGSSRRSFISMPEGAWRTVGSLGLVIGLIVGLRSMMTRFGGPLAKARAPSGVIEVLGRFPLSRGQTLILIKLDRRVLLLAQTSQGLSTLSELSDAEQVASLLQRIRNDRGDSFSRQFERLITPVGKGKDTSEIAPTVIDLTQSGKTSAARRVASMLGNGVRA